MRRYSEALKADVRRRMNPPQRQSVARISEEQRALELLDGAVAAGDGGGVDGHGRDGGDRRKGSERHVPHRLSEQERREILAVCNQPQYASLLPAQIAPDLVDQGRYLASESSFYRVLHAHQQVQRRGRARPPQAPRPVPRRRADGPNQLWSWDITYLPTGVRGVWLYLYLGPPE